MRKMRTKADMRRYLRIYRDQYTDGLARLIISRGSWFLGKADADDYEVAGEWVVRESPQAGQCFLNAQKFCLCNPEVRYFEGFLFIRGMPLPHAWNVMQDGMVVDLTYEAADQEMLRDRGYNESLSPLYYGIEVPRRSLSGSGMPIAEQHYCKQG